MTKRERLLGAHTLLSGGGGTVPSPPAALSAHF
jgi:hypothetical protein